MGLQHQHKHTQFTCFRGCPSTSLRRERASASARRSFQKSGSWELPSCTLCSIPTVLVVHEWTAIIALFCRRPHHRTDITAHTLCELEPCDRLSLSLHSVLVREIPLAALYQLRRKRFQGTVEKNEDQTSEHATTSAGESDHESNNGSATVRCTIRFASFRCTGCYSSCFDIFSLTNACRAARHLAHHLISSQVANSEHLCRSSVHVQPNSF